MTRIIAKMRSVAFRIIEASGKTLPQSAHTIDRWIDELRPHLANLMGSGGFNALLSRALVLAKEEMPYLRAIQLSSAGELELSDVDSLVDSKKILEASVVLLTHVLELLVAFIGESLTLQLVREVWPQLSLNNLDFDGEDHE